MTGKTKILFQCDFDGTITEEDVSFALLDAFAEPGWRQLFQDHQAGKLSVGRFNTLAFAMIKANRESLLKVVRNGLKIREGFSDLVALCRRQGFRFVIVSNGLDFYIEAILKDLGLEGIEVRAARTRFHQDGLKVKYIGPDGNHLDNDFKLAHVKSFLSEGYEVIYAGNGISDLSPARQCRHIFATGNLLTHLKQTKLDYTPFTSFRQVVDVLEQWS